MVKVNNGGYEDIVIAINPGVKEDTRIIENIKGMINEASGYLFKATKQRLHIKSVKILLPYSWSGNYAKPKSETYDKADIIIAEPYLKFGDDPYTQQYEGCGSPGKYIHFTPNFMTNDTLLSVYGQRGRAFVHEWAHLRWGVFDEYSLETPYYSVIPFKPEATRCSADIFGVNIIQRCDGCTYDPCNFDSGGLYEEGCVFVPDKSQPVSESLMYMQALTDVTEFCNGNNHNTDAPNLQNQRCNYRSTWDVIMDSSDISSSLPQPSLTIPEPTFTLLQYSERVLTLVLDVSGSMGNYNRIQRLYQAADVFLIQIIETNSSVGMVKFSSSAFVLSQLLQIRSDAERQQLKQLVPTTASGGTNICSGILAGIQVNKGNTGSSHGTEIVLLSDGEDNYDTNLCYSDIINSGAIIHVIFLGLNEEPKLAKISMDTGGVQYLATDEVDTNGLIDAFTGISAGNGMVTQQSLQLESTASTLQPQSCLNGTVFIDSTVGKDTFFLVTWQTAVPNINLADPNGQIYTQAEFVNDSTSRSSRLAISGNAKQGPWVYNLCNAKSTVEAVGIVVNSKAIDENIPPIIVNAHMNQDTSQYPNPMVIYASVSQGLIPVVGAKVTAIIEPVSGAVVTLELLDNGAGPDIIKNDGIYSRYFMQFSVNGRYGLKVRVEGNKSKVRLVAPKNRALYIPGFISNGTISMNPPRPENSDEDLNVGDFSRTASGGSFVVTNVPTDAQPDMYGPEKITDLKAKIETDIIVLSWTATGDDLDQGNASSYDLRMNTNLNDLRNNFNQSTPVDISSVIPQPAGSSETFEFIPENIIIENGTILYFALIAVDKAAHKSDASNIAQAALILPPTPAPTPPSTPKLTTGIPPEAHLPESKLSVSEIALIACSTIIIICIITSITICVVSRHKKEMHQDKMMNI
ncbi:calcium-activated chloride channel regulator 4A-like isoform X2 [Hyperolius riggenbachi]